MVVLFTGDNKSAEILIKAGADLNALGADYGNILQAVAFTRDNKSRRNVNAQVGEYGNALQMVVSRGQKTIIKILIKAGADIHAQGRYYGPCEKRRAQRKSLLSSSAKLT